MIAALIRYGGYTSERHLARAFKYHQQTVNYWKKAKREPAMFREFLSKYARKHDVDEAELVLRGKIVPR